MTFKGFPKTSEILAPRRRERKKGKKSTRNTFKIIDTFVGNGRDGEEKKEKRERERERGE